MTAADHELAKELHATVQARKDLGPDYESELVDSFLEKLTSQLDAQVESRVRRELTQQQMAGARIAAPGRREQHHEFRHRRFGLAVVSLVLAVPLSAIAVTQADLPGLLVAWIGIVGVNVAHSLSTALGQRTERTAHDWD
jgi:hypothetical protein